MSRAIFRSDDLPAENCAVFKLFKRSECTSLGDFAKYVGVYPQSMQRLFRKDVRTGKYPGVSREIRDKIGRRFSLPEGWLERASVEVEVERGKKVRTVEVTLKPRILDYASAGALTDSTPQNVEMRPVVQQLPYYDCTIIVRGDSMEPVFRSGDEIALRNITQSDFRKWGAPHVLDTRQGIVIKNLFEDAAQGGYRCESENKKYKPFFVKEDEVFTVFKIVGFVRAIE